MRVFLRSILVVFLVIFGIIFIVVNFSGAYRCESCVDIASRFAENERQVTVILLRLNDIELENKIHHDEYVDLYNGAAYTQSLVSGMPANFK